MHKFSLYISTIAYVKIKIFQLYSVIYKQKLYHFKLLYSKLSKNVYKLVEKCITQTYIKKHIH